ncbi:hypothetical protein [Chryseobacterium sp.]|uniref:DUF7674 family protein n=1 Tax=Chryseobacterium sp. TaxID=1871047 RepID=UPI0028988A5B|nr:hypothetical protein [Chryseobacterium sp.]
MNHTDAIAEIMEVIPQFQEEFKEKYRTNNSFMVISTFTKQIKTLVKENNQKLLKNSIEKMNQLYEKGDTALKNAIENIFIFSLDSLTFSCDTNCRKLVFEGISTSLRKKYFSQVYKSGI